MITRIGIIAGDIWRILDKCKEIKFSELVSQVDKPRDFILMSLGWLAREGHVVVRGKEDYTISLRKKKG